MNLEKILEFLKQGGLPGVCVIGLIVGYTEVQKMQTDIKSLQAVVIDCYQERIEDLQIKNSSASNMHYEYDPRFAIIPEPIKIKKDESI